MNICLNCGAETKNRKYCSPECFHSIPMSEETKNKLSEWKSGRSTITERGRERLRELNTGRKNSLETRQKLSFSHTGIPNNQLGRKRTEEAKERISKSLIGKPSGKKGKLASLETKERLSKSHQGYQMPDTQKEKIGIVSRERWQNPEYRAQMSKAISEWWKNSPDAAKTRRKMMKNNATLPSASERKLGEILSIRFPNEWKYVGDGEVIIGGKCPDFININGRKQLIEVLGTYWHDIFDVAERTEHFRQYGFSTLCIWEDELSNPERVIKKVKSFNRKS